MSKNKLTCRLTGAEIPDSCVIISGGNPSNPDWDEYLSEYKKEWQPYILAIKECIEKDKLVGTTGSEMANDHYFLFSDGKSIAFTWRGWGDLMQAIVNKREGYMQYYM